MPRLSKLTNSRGQRPTMGCFVFFGRVTALHQPCLPACVPYAVDLAKNSTVRYGIDLVLLLLLLLLVLRIISEVFIF